jgi:hypothetical protein
VNPHRHFNLYYIYNAYKYYLFYNYNIISILVSVKLYLLLIVDYYHLIMVMEDVSDDDVGPA